MNARQYARCEVCQGKGWIRGIFHRMECAACNGGGFIDAATNQALSYSDLVAEQRQRLSLAEQEIKRLGGKVLAAGGPAGDYAGRNNRHHRGGGNWTGD